MTAIPILKTYSLRHISKERLSNKKKIVVVSVYRELSCHKHRNTRRQTMTQAYNTYLFILADVNKRVIKDIITV